MPATEVAGLDLLSSNKRLWILRSMQRHLSPKMAPRARPLRLGLRTVKGSIVEEYLNQSLTRRLTKIVVAQSYLPIFFQLCDSLLESFCPRGKASLCE